MIGASSQIKASANHASLITSSPDEFISENKDLSILLGNSENDDKFYQEYQELEKSCEGLSIKDVTDKAYPYYIKRQDLEKGIMLNRIAISKYESNLSYKQKLHCAVAYGNIGYHLIFERNNPLAAYPYLAKGLEIANQITFPNESQDHTLLINVIVGINTNIAKVFAMYGDYSRAMYYYRNALDIAKKDNNPVSLPLSFTDLLHFVWTSDSLSTITTGITDFRNMKIPNSSLQSMREYANLMAEAAENYLNKRFDKALLLVDSASNRYDIQVDDRRYPIFNRIIAGKIAFAKKDYAKAGEHFAATEKIIREEKLEDMYDLIYRLYTDFHTAIGNTMLAEHYKNEGLKIRDSLYNVQSYSVIRDMELALQTKDYNEELSCSYSKTERWIYIAVSSGILVLIICALIMYIIIKYRKLKKHSEKVFLKNMELMETQKKFENNEVTLIIKETQSGEESQTPVNLKACKESAPGEDIETIGQDESVSDEDLNNIYQQILEYMANSADIFQPTFTIDSLVAAMGLKIKQVSQAINSVGGKNFNTLLGEFRIKKACEIMTETCSDPSQRPTMEVLAEDVGYKSRTHFMRVFKSVTGLTTTEFLKQLKNKKK
ncbi:MAG: helix-turn-helix domain-containing protein [Bacteroides sp.]|nr:helix-turn-helix domain-containing protein [Bacteroides sp.]